MAKNKTKRTKTATKRTTKRTAKPSSTERSEESFAYGVRIPIIADTLRSDFGGSAPEPELFKVLKTKHGEFNKPRRIAATVRYDKRTNGDKSVLVRDGRNIVLRTMSKSMRKALRKRQTQADAG